MSKYAVYPLSVTFMFFSIVGFFAYINSSFHVSNLMFLPFFVICLLFTIGFYKSGVSGHIKHEVNMTFLVTELSDERVTEIRKSHRQSFLKWQKILFLGIIATFIWVCFYGVISVLHEMTSTQLTVEKHSVKILDKGCVEVKPGRFSCYWDLESGSYGYSRLSVPKHIYERHTSSSAELKIRYSLFGSSVVSYK